MFRYDPNILESSQEGQDRLNGIQEYLREIQDDFAFYRRVVRLARIGPWEETDYETLYVTPQWRVIFNENASIETRADYLDRIDTQADRIRIEEARYQLINEKPGTVWEDEFSLLGKKIRSTACVGPNQIICGVDTILS